MNTPPPGSSGWLESFRCIGESLLAMVRNRFELFTVELQEEKLRLLNLLIWIGLAAALGFAGVFVAIVALAFCLWNAAGYVGLIGLAVVSLGAAIGIILGIRKKIQTGPQPFANTVGEFRKDGECLRNNN
ncbi:MAG TPA: phage holin family protein [Candidatus Binatia bacterium]|nr:phage holin family protein [Candidatus Binatia bacterium]